MGREEEEENKNFAIHIQVIYKSLVHIFAYPAQFLLQNFRSYFTERSRHVKKYFDVLRYVHSFELTLDSCDKWPSCLSRLVNYITLYSSKHSLTAQLWPFASSMILWRPSHNRPLLKLQTCFPGFSPRKSFSIFEIVSLM